MLAHLSPLLEGEDAELEGPQSLVLEVDRVVEGLLRSVAPAALN